MRIVFFGTPEAAVPSLEAFVADPDTEVVAVVTNPDRPSGRGYKLTPPPVKAAAERHGLPVWQPEKPREILDHLLALRLDACAVVAYGALLPQDVLDAGGKGFVNLHFSVLPAWRGAAPVQHALLAGDSETGVTCFVLDKGMDTGDVLLVERTPVAPDETAGELMARLADLGAPVLVRAVHGLVDGGIVPVPQDHGAATLAPKIGNDDARLDWDLPAARLHNQVRGLNPVPGAFTTFGGDRLKVHRARVADAAGAPGNAPGEVVAVDEDGPVVACGDGALLLTEVQPAGKPRMSGQAFANGYRPLGAVLGRE
ncbi:MAG TPA: methionyl-tRNA formyltransferase [Egibacteraceae bacterium]|nr:methionyl-tRNA formyltransferase [Egibacteraceae bacterium]